MSSCYTYILLCDNGQFYVGSTDNLERRLQEHQKGIGANFTKAHLPVKLLPLHSIIDIVLNVRYQSLQFSCNSGYNFVVLLEIMAVEGEASGN